MIINFGTALFQFRILSVYDTSL